MTLSTDTSVLDRPAAVPGNRAVRAMMTTLAMDIGLPVAAYFLADAFGASTYLALLAGTVASGLRLIWVAVRQRRVDAFAVFLLVLFGAGLALSFVTGDPRFLLVKDSATSAAAGLALAGSCLINRPLAYYAAKRMAGAGGRAQFLATANTAAMRARWFRVSLVWGVALLTDSVLRVAAAYLLPIHTAATVSQILMVAVYVGLLGWTMRSRARHATA